MHVLTYFKGFIVILRAFAYVFGVISVTVAPMVVVYLAEIFRYNLRGIRIKKGHSKPKRQSVLYRLYVQFPRMLAYDAVHREPDEFKEYGVHLFCGEQGSGKTVAVVEMIRRMQYRYPMLKSRSNIRCDFCSGHFDTWKELISNDNGVYGQIEFIDEIHNWFSSAMSLNFPPQMLSEITQQRKQRKMIVGTTQVFGRISKQLRQEASFVYLPMTFLGCLTIVRVSKPIYYDDNKAKFKKYIRTYFFVHDLQLRNAYDTYEKVGKYIQHGFVPRSEQLEEKEEPKIEKK